ncbi:DUF3352 domain-containing protein [Candidatus Peregrinibacteria bacterium]|nr:DUF3352 domain-containing protein [Candidatus Peregrinibacteria bacterium]
MRNSKFLITLTGLGVLTVLVLLLSGCGPSKMQIPESEKSAQGVVLEDFLPENTIMSFSINTHDALQKDKFEKIKSYFPSDDFENLVKSALEDLNMELTSSGLTYENDIAPIFSDSFKAVFAMSGNLYEKNSDPDIYIAFTIGDEQKAEALIKTAAERNRNLEIKKPFDFLALDNEKKEMFLALYKDTILITNTSKTRYEALKRQRNNEPSLLANENFKKAYESLPKPNLGIAYINVQNLFEDLAKLEGSDMKNVPYINALTFEAFALMAESDGLKMIVQVGFNPDEKNFSLADFPYKEPYLYKKIPGNDLLIYTEAYGLKEIFDLQTQMLLASEDDRKDFENAKKMIKKYVNLDIDKDVLTWMDKGYALVIQRNNDIIPGISFYIDASSDTRGAAKTLEVIDSAFDQLVETLKKESLQVPAGKIIAKETVETNRGNINKVSFNFSDLSKEELDALNLPSGFFTEPVEVWYGLTRDNLFVFSTLAGLDEGLNSENTVDKNPLIVEAMGHIKDYPCQLSYISIDEAVIYAERFIETMILIEGEPPKDVSEGFAKVKEYLAPVKYLVGGNQKVENIAEGMMFIKIGE